MPVKTISLAGMYPLWTAVHDLTMEEEADGPIALSGPLPNGMQSRLRPLSDGRRVFCIYNNRVSERRPSMNFTIEDLKVNFCDDVVYGYVGLDGTSTTIRSKHPKYDFLEEGLKRFVGLKRSNPEVTLWACLGGSVEDGPRFVALVKERRTRVTFARNSAEWLRRNEFQGLLIYWKYPKHEHRINFTVLLADLHNSYMSDGLLLSAVLPMNTRLRRESYLRTVRLRKPGRGAGGRAPVARPTPLSIGDVRDVRAHSASHVAPRSLHQVGAAAAGPGAPGERTNESGLLSYVEVQDKLRNEGWKRSYHHYGHCPFARKDLQWVAYEDEQSVADKAIVTSICTGLAVWDADMDDFAGILGKPCTLLRKLHEVVHTSASQHKIPSPPKSYRKFF
ncbi:hypothetical protein MRX96_027414 [Rhipicephalus microplus]